MSDASSKFGLRALASIADRVAAVVAGIAAFLFLVLVFVTRLQTLPPSLARFANADRFLRARADQVAAADASFVLGSSIAIEGIDAIEVERAGGPKEIYNLAWTDGGFRQWPMIFPSLARAHTKTAILVVDWPSLARLAPISPERLRVASLEGMSNLDDIAPLLLPTEVSVLSEGFLRRLIALRQLPLGAADAFLREVTRRDLRYAGHVTNFRDPWVLTASVPKASLELNLRQFEETISRSTPKDEDDSIRSLAAQLMWAKKFPLRVVVVRSPSHPDLIHRVGEARHTRSRELLRATCSEVGVALIDHATLLPSEEFADAVHPNAAGRRTWSAALGEQLAKLSSAPQ